MKKLLAFLTLGLGLYSVNASAELNWDPPTQQDIYYQIVGWCELFEPACDAEAAGFADTYQEQWGEWNAYVTSCWQEFGQQFPWICEYYATYEQAWLNAEFYCYNLIDYALWCGIYPDPGAEFCF